MNWTVSELRSRGFIIQSSGERDPHGSLYLRLNKESKAVAFAMRV
jgi:hypothetical protein